MGGRGAASAERDITDLLFHEHWGVREAAATTLGTLGDLALPTVLALIEALTDKFVCVRTATAKSLGERRDRAPMVVPAVIELLSHDRLGVRCTAAEALGAFGPAAAAATSALEKCAYTDVDCSV